MNLSFKKSILLTALRSSGAGLSLLLSLVIARTSGSEGSGLYYSFTAIVVFVSIAISFGDLQRLLRAISLNLKDAENMLIRFQCIFLGRASLIAILFITLASLYYLFSGVNYVFLSLGLVVVSTVSVLISSIGNYYNGKDKQFFSSVYTSFALPAASLATAWFFVYRISDSPSYLVLWFVVAYGAVYVFSITNLSCPRPRDLFGDKLFPSSDSLRVTGTVLFTHLGAWSCTFILMIFSNQSDIGIFNTVLRLTIVSAIIAGVLSAMSAPHFARIEDHSELQNHVCQNARFSLLMGVVALLPIGLLGGFILSLFGEEFLKGLVALWVLVVAKIIALSFGTLGYLLLLRGMYTLQFLSVVLGVVTQVSVGVVLIPADPILGAAVALSSGIILEKVFQAYFGSRELGINLFFAWMR